MSGLIKSDFKKLFKNRSLVLCAIISFVVAAFTVLVMDLAYELNMGENGFMQQYYNMIGAADPSALEMLEQMFSMGTSMGLITTMISDSSIQTFIAICICLYVASEYSHGTLKITVSRGFSRHNIYFSKAIVASVSSVIISFAYMAGVIVTSLLCSKVTDDFDITKIIVQFSVYLVVVLGITSMFYMVSMIIKKTGLAIIVCIAAPMGVETILGLLAGAVDNLSDYTRFWLPSTFATINSSYSENMLWLPIVISLAYIAVTYCIGTFAFSKRDIK